MEVRELVATEVPDSNSVMITSPETDRVAIVTLRDTNHTRPSFEVELSNGVLIGGELPRVWCWNRACRFVAEGV